MQTKFPNACILYKANQVTTNNNLLDFDYKPTGTTSKLGFNAYVQDQVTNNKTKLHLNCIPLYVFCRISDE